VTESQRSYWKAAALAAGVSASMLVLGSGTARADESSYIQMLDVGGVPYDTPPGAVLMGNTATMATWGRS
jgi:hypothetical protein